MPDDVEAEPTFVGPEVFTYWSWPVMFWVVSTLSMPTLQAVIVEPVSIGTG